MYDFDSAMRAYREDVAFRTLVSNGRPTLALTAQEAERLGLRITKP
jgi:hypothetical protein